ncbi:hypothetical protein [Streptomyces sp. Rer75]|uniref:hypothetical protein n=1 Tax=unclassified Streptomyces TaxID=2593676 RepID=UPI0015CF9CB9|nr:hypothetical protein [Streptomyces sp. Rer75]QLH23732.1 hypothetical protein HYQ63_26520 [Streptomyces sp. Rer75]
MSDIAGASNGVHPISRPTVGPEGDEVAHEAYAFACMKCGHGWERSYDIEHHVDGEGHPFVVYFTDGTRVPSPLTSPDCVNCGAHLVRIMRAGQVSSVLESARRTPPRGAPKAGPDGAGPDGGADTEGTTRRRGHHWHLSNLLHPFSHRK